METEKRTWFGTLQYENLLQLTVGIRSVRRDCGQESHTWAESMETWPVHMGESRGTRGESRCQVEGSPCWTGMEGLEARRMDLPYAPSVRVSVCQCSYPLLKQTFSDFEGISECRETTLPHLFPPASGAPFLPQTLPYLLVSALEI